MFNKIIKQDNSHVQSYAEALLLVADAIKSIKNEVTVESPIVNIDTDSIIEQLKSVLRAFSDLEVRVESPVVNIPETKIDVKGIIKSLSDVKDTIVATKAIDTQSLRNILSDALDGIYKTDPKRYLPVRLTNGKEFITGIASAVGSNSGIIRDIDGNPVTVTGGKLDVNATIPPITIDTTGLATDAIQTDGTQKHR